MNRRFRLLAALLALFAFSAYFAEGVWAAVCPPGMETGSHAVGEAAPGGAYAGVHHASVPDADDHGTSHSDSAPCPLGMPGAGGSCVAVSLPAVGGVMQPEPLVHAPAVGLLDTTHDRLLVAGPFRPPRA